MADKKYIDGLYVKNPHENAPDYVIGSIDFKVDTFIGFLKEHAYKGYVNVDLKKSKKGELYAQLNEWKPTGKAENSSVREEDNDLNSIPF